MRLPVELDAALAEVVGAVVTRVEEEERALVTTLLVEMTEDLGCRRMVVVGSVICAPPRRAAPRPAVNAQSSNPLKTSKSLWQLHLIF